MLTTEHRKGHSSHFSLPLGLQNQYDQSQGKHLTAPLQAARTEAKTATPKASPPVAMPIYAVSFSLLQRKK